MWVWLDVWVGGFVSVYECVCVGVDGWICMYMSVDVHTQVALAYSY